MTPIDQIKPTQPGNWARRPEKRRKPADTPQESARKKRHPQDYPAGSGNEPHIVDELA